MKKLLKLLSILSLFSLLIISVISCNKETSNQGIEVNDLLERKINVTPGKYFKVVCIGAGALRLYSYIGDINKLAGVEDIDNSSLEQRPKMFDSVARPYFIMYEDVFKNLPSCGVGGPQSQITETEKILNCNPDIIISEYEDKDKSDALQNTINVPVVVVSYGPNGVFDERCHRSLNLLGKIFDNETKANKLTSFINENKNEIENRTKNVDQATAKKVYISGLGNYGTTNHLMTAQNYAPFNIAHINNVVNDLSKDGIQAIEKEKFEALAPNMDIMIFDAAAIKNIKALYNDDSHIFDNCKAWQNGEVYLEMAYNAYYTNLEIALCNTWFNAKVVYPELFSDINIIDKLDTITEMFLGAKLANKINKYPMSYGGYQKINKETIFA